MNILKNVINKIAESDKKTELASQKVELGLIDDLNKALDDSQQIIERLKEGNALIKRDTGYLEREEKEMQKRLANRKKADDVYFKLEDKFLKAKRDKAEAYEKVERTSKEIEDLKGRIENVNKKKAPLSKKAQNLITVFEKNIKKAEAAAKDLGLKLPIAKYTKAQDNLRKNL